MPARGAGQGRRGAEESGACAARRALCAAAAAAAGAGAGAARDGGGASGRDSALSAGKRRPPAAARCARAEALPAAPGLPPPRRPPRWRGRERLRESKRRGNRGSAGARVCESAAAPLLSRSTPRTRGEEASLPAEGLLTWRRGNVLLRPAPGPHRAPGVGAEGPGAGGRRLVGREPGVRKNRNLMEKPYMKRNTNCLHQVVKRKHYFLQRWKNYLQKSHRGQSTSSFVYLQSRSNQLPLNLNRVAWHFENMPAGRDEGCVNSWVRPLLQNPFFYWLSLEVTSKKYMSCDEAVITGKKERFVFLYESSAKIFKAALFEMIVKLILLNIALFSE